MKVLAKFKCTHITDFPSYEQKRAVFEAVINDCEENKSFAKYTPSGSISMNISYDTYASEAFEEGKEYFVTFDDHKDILISSDNEVVSDKRLRKALDALIQQIKALNPSSERDISIMKIQEAVMWLGMDLKRLNEPNPYPSSKDTSTGDTIEPTADGLKM